MLISLVQSLLAALTIASILYFLACIFASIRFASIQSKAKKRSKLPPVSILIPLCGADFAAYENYASFCRQDYPTYQIVFGVQDSRDSSIPVIRKLMADFPEMDIKLVIGAGSIGANPKVNNLYNMLAQASHEVLVIADSDIRVGSDYLVSVIPQLADDRVGLVTCFYRAGAAPNFASTIEALGITGDFAPGVLIAWLTEGITFALGATMVTSVGKLQSIGGLRAIADYLADDYMLGNLVFKAGYEVRLAPYVVETMLHDMEFGRMLKHQIRWGRGIRACRPMGYLGSIVTHGTVPALANLVVSEGSALSLILLFAVLGLRLSVAWLVGVCLLGDRILKKAIWLLPVKDILSFYIFCMSAIGRKVEWRGRTFKIVDGGKMVPVGTDPE